MKSVWENISEKEVILNQENDIRKGSKISQGSNIKSNS